MITFFLNMLAVLPFSRSLVRLSSRTTCAAICPRYTEFYVARSEGLRSDRREAADHGATRPAGLRGWGLLRIRENLPSVVLSSSRGGVSGERLNSMGKPARSRPSSKGLK
jgi:hypothetical protein